MRKIFVIFLLLPFISCKRPFTPPPIIAYHHYLVVEGYINGGTGITTITLTRTRNVTDTGSRRNISGVPDTLFEPGAIVNVEDSNSGNNYRLSEVGEGQYGGVHLELNPKNKYRLDIITKDGLEYASSWLPVMPAPEIDSVYWRLKEDGAYIYLDSHGNNTASRYYRMDYEATWEFHTWFHSSLTYKTFDTSFLNRPPSKYVDTCWRTIVPTNVLISNTTFLTTNLVSHKMLTSIPTHSESLSILYSILVKAYSISQSEYQFWDLLKKNTEELGSIFDSQPSMAGGNIKCVSDPSVPAIGYVGVCIPAEKRIWISNKELPDSWNGNGNFYECVLKTIPDNKDTIAYYFEGPLDLFTAVDAIRNLHGEITGYEISRRRCADCTQRGTTVKPSFWP
jgi:hypothetical protein